MKFHTISVPSNTLETFTYLYKEDQQFRSLALQWAIERPANGPTPDFSKSWDNRSMVALINLFANLKFGWLFYCQDPAGFVLSKYNFRLWHNS